MQRLTATIETAVEKTVAEMYLLYFSFCLKSSLEVDTNIE